MSLINDALRRAGEADRKKKGPPPPVMPLQPAPPARPGSGGLGWLLLLLFVALSIAGVFLWRAGQRTVPPLSELRAVTNGPAKTPAIDPASLATGTLAAVTSPTRMSLAEETGLRRGVKVNTNVLVRRPAPDSARLASSNHLSTASAEEVSTLPTPEALKFPDLKLQSIIYRLQKPWAMINGQTVETGDEVAGVVVTEIHRQFVVVSWQGSNRVLSLPRF